VERLLSCLPIMPSPDFIPRTALDYARIISRPRLVGSGEDEKVAQELVDKFKSFGYTVEREPFQFTRAFDHALSIEIILAFVFIVCALFTPYKLLFGVLILGLLAIVQPLNNLIHSHAVAADPLPGESVSALQALILRWGRRYRTANIIARPATQPTSEQAPHLYLVAHFDSKSQRLPLMMRVVFIVLFLISIVLFALTAVLSVPSFQIGLVAILLGLPLLFLGLGNDSPGSIDNASGTGLVLHLAEVLRARRVLLRKVRVTILITSAEELGTMGALFHVRQRKAALKMQNLKVLNFDGIGTDGRLSLIGVQADQALVAMIETAAEEAAIPLSRFNIIGALYDHIPFAQQELDAVTLVTVGTDGFGVHTRADYTDKLSLFGFDRAGKIALRVLEMLAEG
jgi:Peptidase family M28